MARLVKRHSDMMLVTFSTRGWKPREEESMKSFDPSYNPFYFEEVLHSLALEEGIHYLGLQTKFREH